MKRKLIFYISALALMLFVGGMSAYAFFEKVISNETTLTYSATLGNTQNIASYTDFYTYAKNYSETSKTFNSNDKESVPSTRFTMNITADIKLMNDVTITSDCNITIASGKAIDLNGYNLIISNPFDGAMYISGDVGSITDTSAVTTNNIIVNCPYSAVIFADGIIDEASVNKTTIAESSTEVINSAFRYIFANLQNTGINDFYTTVSTETNISNHTCSMDGTHTENSLGCIYTYTDLEFIYNYLTYDLNIQYESSNVLMLSNNGNIVGDINTSSYIVPLTITIEGTSRIIDVHLITEGDYAKASLNVMTNYLHKYYGQKLDDNGNAVDGSYLYRFDGPISLPAYDVYFDKNYVYTLNGEAIVDPIATDAATLNSEYFELIDAGDGKEKYDYYILYIDSKINTLTISVGEISTSLTVQQLAEDLLMDNESYAASFMRDLYGNQIEITVNKDNYSGYTETYLLTTPNADIYSYGKINSVSYIIRGDSDNTYEIVDGKTENGAVWQLLRHNVNSTVKPNITQTIFLEASFDFFEGDDPIVQLSIIYVHDKQDGDSFGFDDFIQYYTFFNREFGLASNNYTYNDFELPFTFGTKLPAYSFKVYEKVYNDTLGKYVYQESNDGLFTFKLKSGENEYILDDLISSGTAGTTITNAVTSGTAKLLVDINPYYINMDTTDYVFIYVPIYTSGSSAYYLWDDKSGAGSQQYTTLNDIRIATEDTYVLQAAIDMYDYISLLSIPGIVRYQHTNSIATEEFTDSRLYENVYSKIYFDTYIDGTTFIETDLLAEVKDITLTTNTYSSLRGLHLLKNVSVLNLNDFTLSGGTLLISNVSDTTEISYIAQMTGLTELYLKNTGLRDYTTAATSLPSGSSNNFLSILAGLYNLQRLDISNDTSISNLNRIYEFAALTEFASLKYVDVSNITFESTYGSILGFDLGAMFEGFSNSLYGSGGASNVGVKSILESKGVETYGFVAKDSSLSDVAYVISNLEYQELVSNNVSLDTVISQYVQGSSTDANGNKNPNFADVYNYYGLKTEYDLSPDSSMTFKLSLTTVSFKVIDDYSFSFDITYHYVAKTSGLFPQSSEGDVPFSYTYHVKRY